MGVSSSSMSIGSPRFWDRRFARRGQEIGIFSFSEQTPRGSLRVETVGVDVLVMKGLTPSPNNASV